MSVTKLVTKASQGKKVYFDIHVEVIVRDGREGMVAAAGGDWLHCVLCQEAGWTPVLGSLPHLYSVCNSVQGMVLSTFRMGLPFLAEPFWKHPHKRSQRYVHLLILNPVKLTVKARHPK